MIALPRTAVRVLASRRIASAALLVAMVVALLLAVPSLGDIFDRADDMRPGWVVAALLLELLSCLAFVAVFRLFFGSVAPAVARRVAWTEMASGALLPGGGVTGLAAGGWLVGLAGKPSGWIVRRSSALFFLTSGVNVAALAAGGALLATGISGGPHDVLRAGVPIAVGLGAIAVALGVGRFVPARPRRGLVSELAAGIREAERAAARPSWRVAAGIGYLGFDIAVLWASLRGLGYAPAIGALVVAYLAGYLATWMPIPGGLAVLDGGLAGALALYGMPPATAAAAVLVYHAIALWVPSVGGLIAYALLRRRLVQASPDPRPVGRPTLAASDGERIRLTAPTPTSALRARQHAGRQPGSARAPSG
ncbi:MAG: YbhN family protein [Solirubrobacteraceae bacterium]